MISDQEIVGCLMLVFVLTYVGYRIDMERISVTNRSVPSKTERGEAPRELGWWKKPARCKLGFHRVRRVHAFIGMDPTAAECPACHKIVPWSGTDDGWMWMSYDKPNERRVWMGGLNTAGPPELRDLREVYWIDDPIAVKVVREPVAIVPMTQEEKALRMYEKAMEEMEEGFARGGSITGTALATTGDCAICAGPLYGPLRVCEDCCREGRGA